MRYRERDTSNDHPYDKGRLIDVDLEPAMVQITTKLALPQKWSYERRKAFAEAYARS